MTARFPDQTRFVRDLVNQNFALRLALATRDRDYASLAGPLPPEGFFTTPPAPKDHPQ